MTAYTRWVIDAAGLAIQDDGGNDLARLEPTGVFNVLLMDTTKEGDTRHSYKVLRPGPTTELSVWGPGGLAIMVNV